MKLNPLALPALRGTFGDWIYYSCLIPITDLAQRVHYAEEVHSSKALSELIQRSLEDTRAKSIAEYLSSSPERFFNALVLATYGGQPDWAEIGNFKRSTHTDVLDIAPESSRDAFGFLRLSGAEKIFAIDGQHRLAGIKRAVDDESAEKSDLVPVIIVGHKTNKKGLQRTRRLFTTLNKTAIPVRKRDIIALDEDDVMAIITRKLVEEHPWFRDPKIAIISSPNIPATNRTALTTISSLYDILKLIFTYHAGSDRNLRFRRPSDERIENFYDLAVGYFNAISETFDPIKELFESPSPEITTSKYRGAQGGNVLFRVIGLELLTRLTIKIADKHNIDLASSVRKLSLLPVELSAPPFNNVIWDPIRKRMILKGKSTALNILYYLFDIEQSAEGIIPNYAFAVGTENLARKTLSQIKENIQAG
jgi:DNA sulfur modification protein DndB